MKFLKVICAILAFGLIACEEPNYGTGSPLIIPSLGTPESNEIWFSTTDALSLISLDENGFDVAIEEILYDEGFCSIIRFAGPVRVIKERAFANCHNLRNISLPGSINTIEKEAFWECKNLEALTLGGGLASCGDRAFDNCINLFSLHIPSIYRWCEIDFASPTANPLYYAEQFIVNDTRVKTINIDNRTTKIHDYAFYNYTMLQAVTLHSKIESIGRQAFEGCENISKVYFRGEDRDWCKLSFEDERANPLSIATRLYLTDDFATTSQEVTKLELEGVSNINAYAFINCVSLKQLSADNALSTIGTEAFRNCTSLTSVSLGSGVKEIGDKAFMNCKKLNSVTIMATEPPTLGDSYVFEYNPSDRKIYVPHEAYDAYLADTMWKIYSKSIKEL
ncbi:MAG: leucine-rich repeat domain-containing protein [Alistipes sp.]|nr:leucine-rich repeat domain-containing protein [Alistipes sp.]